MMEGTAFAKERRLTSDRRKACSKRKKNKTRMEIPSVRHCIRKDREAKLVKKKDFRQMIETKVA